MAFKFSISLAASQLELLLQSGQVRSGNDAALKQKLENRKIGKLLLVRMVVKCTPVLIGSCHFAHSRGWGREMTSLTSVGSGIEWGLSGSSGARYIIICREIQAIKNVKSHQSVTRCGYAATADPKYRQNIPRLGTLSNTISVSCRLPACFVRSLFNQIRLTSGRI